MRTGLFVLAYARGVRRSKIVLCTLFFAMLSVALAFACSLSFSTPAWAQGPVDTATPDAATSAAPAPAPLSAPVPSSSESAPRPMRGPAVRERGGRRSRGASTASGALMLFLLVGWMGYYVVKKLRR
jgi:hypothetical protein